MTNVCISCYGRQQPIKPATEAGSINKYVNVKFTSDQCDCLLFDSMLYVKVNTFPFMSDGFPGLNQYLALRIGCLAYQHNKVPLVRLEPAKRSVPLASVAFTKCAAA